MDSGGEGGFGAVLRRKSPMWPNTQYFARLEYCAPFQKRSKTTIGYKNGSKIREHDSEVIE